MLTSKQKDKNATPTVQEQGQDGTLKAQNGTPEAQDGILKAQDVIPKALDEKAADVMYKVHATDGHFGNTYLNKVTFKGIAKELEAQDIKSEDSPHILVYRVEATGTFGPQLGEKQDFTSQDFEQQFIVSDTGYKEIFISSPLLQSVMKSLIVYHPEQMSQGTFTKFVCRTRGSFRNLLLYYRDLRAFYSKSLLDNGLLKEHALAHKPFDIGDCGDDQLKDTKYNMGSLNEKTWDLETFRHISVLLKFLAPLYRKTIVPELINYELPEPIVKYDMLWLLFKPGEDVYFKTKDTWNGGVVHSVEYKERELDHERRRREEERRHREEETVPMFVITIWSLVYKNRRIQRVSQEFKIEQFADQQTRLITSLPLFPCKFWDHKDPLRRKELVTAGKRYLKLLSTGFAYRHYNDPDKLVGLTRLY